jgi:hypothetical protein
MKNAFFAFLFLISTTSIYAQAIDTINAGRRIRTAADLKTGNSQDVLISFFQLALNDITGKEKTFRFQSSLFGLKAKTDPSLFVDTNFLKQTRSRNFVFTIAPSVDSNFKFKQNTVGIKYALINNRDKAIFDFALPSEDEWNRVHTSALQEYARALPGGVTDPKYKLARNFFLDVEEDEDGNKRTPLAQVPKDFQIILQNRLAQSNSFRFSSFENFRDTLAGEYADLARYVENRSLWTVDANFAHDRNASFSKVNFNSEFLKGLFPNSSRSNLELNLRASLNFDDDTTTRVSTDLHRQVFSFAGGFNWIVTKNRRRQSVVELKGAISYNNIFKGVYNGEERNKFLAEGTFRIRISNDFWIPFDIQYDPNSGNVFGFLSVRSNFDWIRALRQP